MTNDNDNLLHFWYDCALRHKGRNWLCSREPHAKGIKGGDKWQCIGYGDAAERIGRLAEALLDIGLTNDMRVILLSGGSWQWVVGNFAILASGGISVPAYTTYRAEDYAYLVRDSGARFAIVENAALAETLLCDSAESLEKLIFMQAPPNLQEFKRRYDSVAFYVWDELTANAAKQNWHDLPGCRKDSLDTAVIIYTSGTVSNPIGVALSHKSLLSNMRGCQAVVQKIAFIGRGQERFLSFLPLSHAYEFMCGQFLTASMGAEVYFTTIEALRKDMRLVRPTMMTAVPRLYEAFYGHIRQSLNSASPMKRWLFEKTLALGKRHYLKVQSMGLAQRIGNFLLGFLVRRKVRQILGGRLKAFVSGGAALNPEVALFFTALDVLILQGYGLTEASPVVSVNVPRAGTQKPDDIDGVGKPLQGVQVKIADDGEILIKGDLLMNGYWGNKQKTAESLRDGWLHSGDVGYLDSHGRLHITDRKKDIIVTAGGDNIAPQKLENLLVLQASIHQAVVYADDKSHIAALIVAAEKGAVGEAVAKVNESLSAAEKIRNYQIIEQEFTIENGLMTPSMKLRRRKILQKYL